MITLDLHSIKPVCSDLTEGDPAADLLWRIQHAQSPMLLDMAILEIPRTVGTSGADYDAMIEASAARRIQFELGG